MTRLTDIADAAARAALADYFVKVDRLLAPLPQPAAMELRGELEAHALDLLTEEGDAQAALARLGDPEEFLPDTVAEKLRGRAAKSFSPLHVTAALASSARAGIAGLILSTVAGIGYALAALGIAMGTARILGQTSTGLFRLEDGRYFLGFGETLGGTDLLGLWFVPLAYAASLILYFILTFAFGRMRLRTTVRQGSKPMPG
jgi:hypothetical protein